MPTTSREHSGACLGGQSVEREDGEEVLQLPVDVSNDGHFVVRRDVDVLQRVLAREDLAGLRQQVQRVLPSAIKTIAEWTR